VAWGRGGGGGVREMTVSLKKFSFFNATGAAEKKAGRAVRKWPSSSRVGKTAQGVKKRGPKHTVRRENIILKGQTKAGGRGLKGRMG